MTYWAINAVFLAAVGVLVVAAVLARRAPRWGAVGIAALVLVLMTAVFDNVMIGIGLVDYDASLISGARVGVAPIEDFAYTVAVLLGLPALWHLLPASASRLVGSGRSRRPIATETHQPADGADGGAA